MKRATIIAALAVVVIGIGSVTWMGQNRAKSSPAHLNDQVTFSDFQNGLSTAKASDYVHRSGFTVKSTAAFEEMRAYLLAYYAGVTPTRTIVSGNQIIDCVPISQQPSLRMQGDGSIAVPPSPPPPSSPIPGGATGSTANAPQATEVVSGGGCDKGSIPLMRITLDDTSRAETLDDFFSKD